MTSSSSSSSNTTNSNLISYDWVIPNFSKCISPNTKKIPFPSNSGIQVNFWLNSRQTLEIVSDSLYTIIVVYLVSSNQDRQIIKLKHRSSILNVRGEKCFTHEAIGTLQERESTCAPICILRSEILDSANGWLVNDTLTVRCEAELLGSDNSKGFNFNPCNFSSISQHYESLLQSGKHSDVVLSIGNQKEYPAHKLVLSTRSSVFSAMFDHSDTKEAQQGRVNIVDVAVEVFELFLRYIYTDKIDDGLDRFAPELLAVADMYQMDCLKSLCEHFLCSTLTIVNVSKLFIHADLYRAELLKSKCADYITNNSKAVKGTQGWKAVAVKADLLELLFEKFSVKFDFTNSK